jgi:hypothetical protein
MVATNQIKKLRESNLLLGDQPFSLPFELFKNTRKTPKSSNPVLSAAKPWFSQGFSHIRPIALAFCAYPCMSMPAGAASSCALPWPLVSRPLSRQSRPRTLVFLGKTCCFVAEVQDSNQVSSNRSGIHCQSKDVGNARVVLRYRMLRPKQPITPSVDRSASKCLISLNFGSRLACAIGCVVAVYRV